MTTTPELTRRQQSVLKAIQGLCKRNGRPPTVRELGAAIGVDNPNGVVCHLRALDKKGAIQWEHGRARGIQITGACPCCGQNTKGKP